MKELQRVFVTVAYKSTTECATYKVILFSSSGSSFSLWLSAPKIWDWFSHWLVMLSRYYLNQNNGITWLTNSNRNSASYMAWRLSLCWIFICKQDSLLWKHRIHLLIFIWFLYCCPHIDVISGIEGLQDSPIRMVELKFHSVHNVIKMDNNFGIIGKKKKTLSSLIITCREACYQFFVVFKYMDWGNVFTMHIVNHFYVDIVSLSIRSCKL